MRVHVTPEQLISDQTYKTMTEADLTADVIGRPLRERLDQKRLHGSLPAFTVGRTVKEK